MIFFLQGVPKVPSKLPQGPRGRDPRRLRRPGRDHAAALRHGHSQRHLHVQRPLRAVRLRPRGRISADGAASQQQRIGKGRFERGRSVDERFSPGQRVAVHLPVGQGGRRLQKGAGDEAVLAGEVPPRAEGDADAGGGSVERGESWRRRRWFVERWVAEYGGN